MCNTLHRENGLFVLFLLLLVRPYGFDYKRITLVVTLLFVSSAHRLGRLRGTSMLEKKLRGNSGVFFVVSSSHPTPPPSNRLIPDPVVPDLGPFLGTSQDVPSSHGQNEIVRFVRRETKERYDKLCERYKTFCSPYLCEESLVQKSTT